MITLARLLPLVTVAAWLIGLVLPVLDSGNTNGGRIVVTSLGGDVLEWGDVEPAFVVAWVGVVGCAVSAWLLRSLTAWSVAALLIAVALISWLGAMIADPPSLIWDGQDAQGRPTAGMEFGRPAAGALAWTIGIAALAAAAVCGWIGSRSTRTAAH